MVQIFKKTKHRWSAAKVVIPLIYVCGALLGLSSYVHLGDNPAYDLYDQTNSHKDDDTVTPKPPKTNVPSLSSRSSDFSFLSSHYTPLLIMGDGWDVSPVVVEEYKLIFFTVPKTGCTVFKQLFRRMMGYQDWPNDRQPDMPHNPQVNGLKYLAQFPMRTVKHMLTSPDWTRAIFVRDPKERVLSSYLDKALHENGTHVKRKCCGIKRGRDRNINDMQFRKWQKEHQIRVKEKNEHQALQSSRRNDPWQNMKQRRLSAYEPGQKEHQPQMLQSARVAKTLLTQSYSNNRRRLQQKSMRSMNALHSMAALAGTQSGMRIPSDLDAPAVPIGVKLPESCSNLTTSPDSIISFETFVYEFLDTCNDPHWRPLSQRMDELVWKHINFVGSFDRLEQDARRMLEQIGAWEGFGATGWPGGSIFANNSARHKTMASGHLSDYYTPEVERVVYRLYQSDYEHPIMNFPKPANYAKYLHDYGPTR